MLIKFAVKNYRGFKDKIEWDLSHPNNYSFNEFALKDGIIKNGIIYGPNGSGKSNFSYAIFDIVNHLSQKMKKPDYYTKNFIYAGNPDGLVDFEYTFKFDDDYITYYYSKNAVGVIKKEVLFVNNIKAFSKENDTVYFNPDEFIIAEEVKKQLALSVNNISIVSFLLMSYPLTANSYLVKLHNFVDSMLWFRSLHENEFIGLESSPSFLDKFIIENNYIQDFQEFIYNISGQKFKFVASSPDENVLYCDIEGYTLPFSAIRSTGTESLELLYFWSKKLHNASFVFIDEFDAFYHYKLAYNVCRMLFGLNCQVFVSTHNTYLMTNKLLRPDCNFILTNNLIKSLFDCTDKELRLGHNIEKLYRGDIFSI